MASSDLNLNFTRAVFYMEPMSASTSDIILLRE